MYGAYTHTHTHTHFILPVPCLQFDSGEILVEYDDSTKLCLQGTANTGVRYASLNGQWTRWVGPKTSRKQAP